MSWFNKKKTEKVNLKKAIATVKLAGDIKVITRIGDASLHFGQIYIYKGDRILHNYLNGDRTLIEFDDGTYTAACNIKSITISVEDYFEEVTY